MSLTKSTLILGFAAALAVAAVSAAHWTGQEAQIETSTVAAARGGSFAYNAVPCIAATAGGKLIVVWISYAGGGQAKLRIVGALSGDGGKTWSEPFLLIDNPGKADADPSLIIDGNRIVVLSTTLPIPGKIALTETWMTASEDEGRTWSLPVSVKQPHRYTDGKVHIGHKLADGRLAVGYSWEVFCEKGMSPATEGEMELKAGMMFSADGGLTWTSGGDIYARPLKITPHAVNGMDEPATVILENGEVYALLRTGTDRLYESRSLDWGRKWSDPVPSLLVSHNAPAALWRLRGSKDVIVVWNNSPRCRFPLSTAMSRDNCLTWSSPRIIAETRGEQVSYPSVTQTPDGIIVVVWQQDLADGKGREIRLARFTPSFF